ncbi:hypothetical protein [Viridibacillus arvi]|uniref:hypothetical protein n=1 Tax=Viridibacillus arvi TaxID=263475 RepID=UPI00187B4E40|nr:hypothetical protein [Viridibacillus sp. JNUCC-6]QOV10943.1 hypothetical protein JNUCC6_20640 [Viridibacillus sp. JNUCC-6]
MAEKIFIADKVTQDAIKTAVDNVNANVDAVKSTVGTVNTNVSSVKTDVSTVNSNVNTVKSQTTAIQSAVNNLNSTNLLNGTFAMARNPGTTVTGRGLIVFVSHSSGGSGYPNSEYDLSVDGNYVSFVAESNSLGAIISFSVGGPIPFKSNFKVPTGGKYVVGYVLF